MLAILSWGRYRQGTSLQKQKCLNIPGSAYGDIVNNKPLINVITYSTHHPVDVCEIFDCTVHMEGRNTKNSKLISDCMKGMIYEIDPSKELFDLINFDGSKVVR